MIADNNPGSVEKREAVACSEKVDSTELNWPDKSVVMTGHLSYESVGDENSDDYQWEYHIDHIQEAPRIAAFDPPDSFTWPSAKPIAAVLPPPGPRYNTADTFQTYIPLRPQQQTYACSNGAVQTMTLEPYDTRGAYRITYRWRGTWKHTAPSADLQGHDPANNLFYDGEFNKAGALRRFAVPRMALPLMPHPGFISKILYQSGAIYPRSWVGSIVATVDFSDAASNERHDHLHVQVYKDAFAKGDLLSAYADDVGLVAMDYYQGKTIVVDCRLTRVEDVSRSKNARTKT
jgi:hypothetical protein